MASVLYEPSSPRGDHGKLVINNKQGISVPFTFKFKIYDDAGQLVDGTIKEDQYIIGIIKENIELLEPLFSFKYDFIANNTVILTLSDNDVATLKPGITYALGFTLYNNDNTVDRVLLRYLPIEVLGTV